MRTSIFISLLILLGIPSFGQEKNVPISLINSIYNKQILIKTDSAILVQKGPIIGYDYFLVKFTQASYDESQCKIRLVGRPCYKDTVACSTGWPGIKIFKGRVTNGILVDQVLLSESLDTSLLALSGNFDISFCFSKDESLFFYTDGFYLEEYKLGELLQRKILSCSNGKPSLKQ